MAKCQSREAEIIRKNMVLLQGGRSDEEMCLKIGAKSPQTWRSRKKNPESMTLGEIRRLCEKCRVDYVAFITKPMKIM